MGELSSGRQALEGADRPRQRPDTRNVAGSQQTSSSDLSGGLVAQMCHGIRARDPI